MSREGEKYSGRVVSWKDGKGGRVVYWKGGRVVCWKCGSGGRVVSWEGGKGGRIVRRKGWLPSQPRTLAGIVNDNQISLNTALLGLPPLPYLVFYQ